MKKILVLILLSVILISAFPVSGSAVSIPDIEHESESALVYCVESGQMLYSRNPDEPLYPTALTKLMTAYLASKHAKTLEDGYNTLVTMSPTAYYSTSGNDIEISINEEMSIYNLLVGLILAGANDCANMLAEEVSGSIEDFVVLMNQTAKELGMNDTYYTNPTGMHEDDMVTTANDMLKLCLHIRSETTITEIAACKTIVIPPTNKREQRAIGTRNFLVSERTTQDYYLPIASGLIYGETTAGGPAIASTASHNGKNYICILLGGTTIVYVDKEEIIETDENGDYVFNDDGTPVILQERETHSVNYCLLEARKLLKWADDSFSFIKAIDKSTPICEIPVKLAKNIDSVALIPKEPIEIFVPADLDRKRDILIEYELDQDVLYAPVQAGQVVGRVSLTYLGDFIGEVPLVVDATVEQNTILVILNSIWRICNTPFMRVALGALIIGSLAYIIITAVDRGKRKKAAKRKYIKENEIKYLK